MYKHWLLSYENRKKLNLSTFSSFLSDGWKVVAAELAINSKGEKNKPLTLEYSSLKYYWDTLTFFGRDLDERGYSLRALSNNFTLSHQEKPLAKTVRMRIEAVSNKGSIKFQQASVASPAEPSVAFLKASGNLLLKGEGSYDLVLKANGSSEQFGQILEYPSWRNLPAIDELKFIGRLNGPLDQPALKGKLQAEQERQACRLETLSLNLELDQERLHISELKLDDIKTNTNISLLFDEKHSIDSSVSIELKNDSSFLRECLPEVREAQAETNRNATQVFLRLLLDSELTFAASGTLKPRDIQTTLKAELHQNLWSARSQFKGRIDIKGSKLHALIEEAGKHLQIRGAKGPSVDSRQTQFTRTRNSIFQAELEYDIEKHFLKAKQFKLARYPSDKLLLWLNFFIPRTTTDKIFRFTSRESLIDSTLQISVPLRETFSREIDGTFKVSNLLLAGVPVHSLQTKLRAEAGYLHFEGIKLEGLGSQVLGDISVSKENELTGSFRGSKLSLLNVSSLPKFPIFQEYDASIDFQLSGTLLNPEYKGLAQFIPSAPSATELQDPLKIEIAGNGDLLRLDADLLNQRGIIHLEHPLNHDAGKELKVNAKFSEFPLKSIIPNLEQESVNDSSNVNSITGTISYLGPRDSPLLGSGEILLQHFSLHGSGYQLFTREAVSMTIERKRLSVEEAKLYTNNRELVVKGYLDYDSGWNARLQGSWDLASFLGNISFLEQAYGGINIDVKVYGPSALPQFKGQVTLESGAVTFPLGESVIGLTNLKGITYLEGQKITIPGIESRIGAGELIVSGEINKLFSSLERQIFLRLALRDAAIETFPNLLTVLDSDLVLEQNHLGNKLRGTVWIPSASYTDRIELTEVVAALTKKIIGLREAKSISAQSGNGTHAKQKPIDLEIRVRAENNLVVETNIAELELKGDIKLGGNTVYPSIDGSIEVVSGVFFLGDTDLHIIQGTARFSDETDNLDPILEIIGDTSVSSSSGDQHQVTVAITGTLTKPNVKFSSDTGLSQNQIASLLGQGTGSNQLTLLKVKQPARTRLGKLLNPASPLSLEERISGITGFSEIKIDPALDPSGSQLSPRLIATRPLIGPTSISYSTQLTGRQVSTVEAEYQLTPYLRMFVDWSTASARTEGDRNTGAASFGINFRKSFSGVNIFPPLFPTEDAKGIDTLP